MYKETREELIQMLEECQTEHHKRNLEVQRLQKAFENIMNELGVPDCAYPAPISNAYEIAKSAIEETRVDTI